MRKGCTLIVKKMWSKYNHWRSFSKSKTVPCITSFFYKFSILASCMANLSKFHVVFSSSTLIRLNKDAFEEHLCQTLIIVSQYSTGPQHNMGCKYMLDVLGWTPLSQRRQEAWLILFYKIINGLAQVPFEGVLVEAYKGTRRKHKMKFRQIGHTTSQYGNLFLS